MSHELDVDALRAKVEDAEDYGVLEVPTSDLLELIGKYEWLTTKLQTTRARAEAAEAKIATGLSLAEGYERHDRPRSVHRFNVARNIRAALGSTS